MKITISKIKKASKHFFEILARKIILFLLFALLIDLFIGAFVFYRYSFLVQKKEVKSAESALIFREKLLSEILKKLKKREERFEGTEFKVYPDVF